MAFFTSDGLFSDFLVALSAAAREFFTSFPCARLFVDYVLFVGAFLFSASGFAVAGILRVSPTKSSFRFN